MIIICGGVVALKGGVTAVLLYGSVGVDEGCERRGWLVGRDPWAGVVRVEVEPREDGLVEDAAGLSAGEAVELLRLGEEVEELLQGHAAFPEVGPFGLVELPL